MKITARLAAFALALTASAAANATTYKFSFIAEPQYAVTGWFDGTADGNIIKNISNLYVFDALGVGFAGNGSLKFEDSFYKSVSVSIDGTENELIVSAADGNGYFQISSFAGTEYSIPVVFTGDYLKNNDYQPSFWKVTAVTSVPEPETYALMLAGLALVGVSARRGKHS